MSSKSEAAAGPAATKKSFGKGSRNVPHHSTKAKRWYPAEDETTPKKVRDLFWALAARARGFADIYAPFIRIGVALVESHEEWMPWTEQLSPTSSGRIVIEAVSNVHSLGPQIS